MRMPARPRFKTPTTALAALCCCLLCGAAVAASGSERPRIGLVLGGGGARGVAHIGVLRTLEELRVPVDCIAGTSMGSLIGGIYAAGVSTAELTERLGEIEWDVLFTDDPPRVEKPYRAKRDDYGNLFRFELGQRGSELLMSPGTTAGYKFEFLLREMVARAGNFSAQDFDQLPIPYRALATNIEDGTSVVFRRGDLVKAMRASMSVPGAIAPVEIDGALYVDGGLLQNVPVAAAREACADVVIVVNVGGGLLPREDLGSALGISLQMINVMMVQNVRQSLESMRPGDVLIEPDLGNFSSANFTEAVSLIEKGETATRARASELRRLALSEPEYRAWRASVEARLPQVPPVSDVQVRTAGERVNPETIERELAKVPGVDLRRRPETDFSLQNLNRRLEQIYGRGDFERMDYQLVDRQGVRTVEVEGVEKSWGPNYVKFGLGFASDAEQTRFNVNASHRSTWLNRLGAEWRNDLQLGYRDLFRSEYFQPLSFSAGTFIAPSIELQDEPIVYYYEGRRLGDYQVSHARAHLDFGAQNKYGELRMGAFVGHLKADEDFGFITLLPDYELTQAGYRASLVFDQIDNPGFPRQGFLASLRAFGTLKAWGSEDEYNKTELLLMAAKTFDRHALQVSAYLGESLSGDMPAYDSFFLGGFQRGSGYRMDELFGDSVALLRTVYSYELTKLPAPLGRGVFVGGSLEATHAKIGIDTDADKKIRPSASLFVGIDSLLGPAYLAWGHAFSDDKANALYLLLGSP